MTAARRRAEPMLTSDPAATPMSSGRVAALILLAGVLDVLGLLSFSYGLQYAETWLVGLASSFGPAVTIVIAVALLGERLRPIQWVGLAGILTGMLAIGLPR
jgi:drug/metabolite transporter (DMT)-like permease